MRFPTKLATLGGVESDRDSWAAPLGPPTGGVRPGPPKTLVGRVTDPLPLPATRRQGALVPMVALMLVVIFSVLAVLWNPGTSAATDLSPAELAGLRAQAEVSTVRLSASSCDGMVRGSGFVVDGLLFTSGHVVEHADAVLVDRPGQPISSSVLATSASLDLAVADASSLLAVALVTSADSGPVGDEVVMAGFPDGGELEVAEARIAGYASAETWGVNGERVMLIEPGVRPGFSGGPVLNRDGDVVGMIVGVDTTTGLSVAVTGSELDEVVKLALETWTEGPGASGSSHSAESCDDP